MSRVAFVRQRANELRACVRHPARARLLKLPHYDYPLAAEASSTICVALSRSPAAAGAIVCRRDSGSVYYARRTTSEIGAAPWLRSGYCSRKAEAVASGLASAVQVAASRNSATCATNNYRAP
jgi:hypothetical protein